MRYILHVCARLCVQWGGNCNQFVSVWTANIEDVVCIRCMTCLTSLITYVKFFIVCLIVINLRKPYLKV